MICPACQAENDFVAEACFICGRAMGALTHLSLVADRYEILQPLGRGGMGTVYKAHDRMLDEAVAIKVLRPEFATTATMAQRFRHEIKLARRVSHRNVCRIHEYGEAGGLRYISMEYVEGVDLRQLALDHGGTLPPAESLEIAIQVTEGLQAIHDVGIVHRDLKATNVMRDTRGVIRLMDFGIAKIEGRNEGSGYPLTTTGQVMGTPEYMSPEQCLGEALDHRSDLYAVGIVLYELLTGNVPFRGESPVATLFKHIQEPVPYEGRSIPPGVVAVLRRALAKSRADRFGTAREMEAELRGALTRPDHAAHTHGTPASHPAAAQDRRLETRLGIPINLVLRRVGALGTVLNEERTIAENIGRGGAQVMTTMASLAIGDVIQLEEVGGRFTTRAEVRGSYVGPDNIRRLNLRFIDCEAPDYLVHVD
jgi:serine/threonine protein kinase